jgi:hypothetical protein
MPWALLGDGQGLGPSRPGVQAFEDVSRATRGNEAI